MTWSPPDLPPWLPPLTSRQTVRNSSRCQRSSCFPRRSISQTLGMCFEGGKKKSAVLNNACLFKWILKHSGRPCSNPSTRSNSAEQGKQLLLQAGRSSFTQDLFLWLNYLQFCIRLAILFFLHKLSKSNWGKLSISGLPHFQILTVHSSLRVRMKINIEKPDKQTLNYLFLSEIIPKVSSRQNRKLMRYALLCPKP